MKSSDDPLPMAAQLDALRAELEAVKTRLHSLEKVVQIYEVDGESHACVECTSVVVRPAEDPRLVSIHIDGQMTDGPFIRFFHGGFDKITTPLCIKVDEAGAPHVELCGPDGNIRGDFFIDNDHGALVVLGPGYRPGAVMRALPGGGSVAVLQRDGKSRAVMIHNDNGKLGAGGDEGPVTELIFPTPDGGTLLKLRADPEGSFVSMGRPGRPVSAYLVTQDDGSSLTLKSPSQATGVVCAVSDPIAQVATFEKEWSKKGSEAALISTREGGSLSLHDPQGVPRVDLTATPGSGTVALRGQDGKEPAVALAHCEGSHSRLTLSHEPGKPGLNILADPNLTALNVDSPEDGKTKILLMAQRQEPTVFVQRDGLVQVALGTNETGGFASAHGSNPDQSGIATLAGGWPAGYLALQSPDGIAQILIDATDHGGRFQVNNDLGFQRILLGTHEESAGLSLNHTGHQGVLISALSVGGLVTVFDGEGRPVESLPTEGFDEDDLGS
jgi:hypothetical protein